MMTMRTRSRSQPQENLDTEQNQMLNLNILGPLFESIKFDFTSFENFRLVCKTWLTASQPRWRRSAWLALEDTKKRTNSHMTIQELQKLVSNPENPHQLLGELQFKRYKVRLTNGLVLNNDEYRRTSSLQFWTIFGARMTHLKIFESKILSAEQLKQVLLEMTPNLQYLSFESNSFDPTVVPFPLNQEEWIRRLDPPWRNEWAPAASQLQKKLTTLELRLGSGKVGFNFPIAWVYILSRFPNIKIMKLRDMSIYYRRGSGYKEFKFYLNSILRIREECDPNFLADLQELDILHDMKCVGRFGDFDLSLQSLRNLRFPLRSLSIDIGFVQTEEGFKEILELYSTTLEKLLAYRGPCGCVFKIEIYHGLFPFGAELHSLSELRLIGTICKNLHFLKNLPNLRVLVLLELAGKHDMEPYMLHSYVDFWKSKLQHKVSPNQKVYGPVHKVVASTNFLGEELHSRVLLKMDEFVIGHEMCTGEQVERLGNLMPNLRKVRLGLDSNGFMLACRIWKKLEFLDVEPFEVDVEAILGIVNGTSYCNPNLTDLQYLKSFRMGPRSDANGKEASETEAILDQIKKALQSSVGIKELHFAVPPKKWRCFGGRAVTSPLLIETNLADVIQDM